MTATLLANTPADPCVLFAEEIDDLLLEARNYLDGESIANEDQAKAVSAILNRARRVAKDADEARKVEKRPHDEAAKAVQAKWTPIIGKADLAAETAKKALTPWLEAIEAENQRKADLARQEAERLATAALEARKSATDLTAQEDAERLLSAAAAAVKDSEKLGKAKAHATGGERNIGLVDVWTPTLVDPILAARHYFATQPQAFEEWLIDQARKDVRSGVRTIPGFEITSERKAR